MLSCIVETRCVWSLISKRTCFGSLRPLEIVPSKRISLVPIELSGYCCIQKVKCFCRRLFMKERGKTDSYYRNRMPLPGWAAGLVLQTLDSLGVHPSGCHQKLGQTSSSQRCRCMQFPQSPKSCICVEIFERYLCPHHRPTYYAPRNHGRRRTGCSITESDIGLAPPAYALSCSEAHHKSVGPSWSPWQD